MVAIEYKLIVNL